MVGARDGKPSRATEGHQCMTLVVPACRGRTDLMFSESVADVREAKALCAVCPVLVHCLFAAVARHELYGTWGGLTAPERAALITEIRRRAS